MKINGILSFKDTKWARALVFLAQATISVLLLFYIGRSLDLAQLKQNVGRIDAKYLFLATLIMPLAVGMRALRWHVLLKSSGLNASFREAWAITWIGQSLNVFLPSSMGEIAKGYFLPQSRGLWNPSIYASMMDKVIGLSAVFFLGMLPCYFLQEKLATLLCFFFWIGTLLVPIILPRISKQFFATAPLLLAKIFFLAVLGWWFSYLVLFILFRPLVGDSVSGLFYFALAPAISIGRLLPISLNGLGVQEWIIVKAMQRLGITPEISFVASLAFTAIMVIFPALIGWGMILQRWFFRNKKSNYI